MIYFKFVIMLFWLAVSWQVCKRRFSFDVRGRQKLGEQLRSNKPAAILDSGGVGEERIDIPPLRRQNGHAPQSQSYLATLAS